MNVTDKIADRVADSLDKYGNNPITEAVKKAFVFLVPVFLIGAGALTLQNFPIEAVRNFFATVLKGKINDFLGSVYDATYGFAAIYLAIAISYCFSLNTTVHKDVKVFFVLNAVICYIGSLGAVVTDSSIDIKAYTNVNNIFPAIIISLTATKLFSAFYKLFNREKLDHSSAFVRSLHSVLPTLCCLIVFSLASTLFGLIDNVNNINDFVNLIFSLPFESIGATYFGGLVIMFAESLFWVFGIHGGNVFNGILESADGPFAFGNGQIMCKQFTDTFALMGGCGTTICLFIALIIFSHDKKKRNLCRLSGAPLLFNINELLVFGVPTVLNLVYLIPFLLTPIVCYSVAYLAVTIGIMPQIVNPNVQWTTPVLISGYRATGSIAGSLVQLFSIILGVAIYAPFVILDNKISAKNERKYIRELTSICKNCEAKGIPYSLDDQRLALRTFEDSLAVKLYSDIKNGKIYLKYQPQVKNGIPVAAEALLRFKFHDDSFIYPPLVVDIACKNKLFDMLSKEIVKRAALDLRKAQQVDPKFSIAVNLKLENLFDKDFRDWLIELVKNSDVTPNTFGVEITEDANLSDADDYTVMFDELKQANIEIFMDDFSMGHTSISMLQKNYFDYIKIDGNLIKQLENERIRSIVLSIINLGKELNFKVIAEYVETEKQRDLLLSMGCDIFQGYLYYKDMPIDDVVNLLKKK